MLVHYVVDVRLGFSQEVGVLMYMYTIVARVVTFYARALCCGCDLDSLRR